MLSLGTSEWERRPSSAGEMRPSDVSGLLSPRYVEDEYVPDYRITVDLDFSQKKLRLSSDRQLNLQVKFVRVHVYVVQQLREC